MVSMRETMRLRRNQSGMASFLIVLIMMIVITLIVLGFSQVTRRNSRETLDRQLSSQAFYAAESGANVATSAIASFVKTNGYTALPTKSSCPANYDPTNQPNGTGQPITPLSNGVQYTCVLVNPNPTTLKYNPTRQGSTVAPILANAALRTLTISWNMQSGGTNKNCTGNQKQFPTSASWTCDYGILRLDMVANPSNVASFTANTTSLFLTPVGSQAALTLPIFGGGSFAHAYIASPIGGTCSAGACQVKITFDPASTVQSYALRMVSLYRDTPNVVISGTTSSGAATFSGAQAVVDTTGQAQDELRRIQVRVQLTASADPQTIPANALSSNANICKHFSVGSSDSIDPSNLCQ